MKKLFPLPPFALFLCVLAPCFAPAQGQPPVIFVHPTNRLASVGATAVFSVAATGAPPLSYRWFKDSVLMDSRTSSTLVLSNVTLVDAGFYHAEVSNPFGTATSRTGYLSLAVSPPVITTQPASRSGFLGGVASFTVTANGALPLFYQWRKDDQSMPGRTSRVLTLSNMVAGDAAFYSVIVSNSFGSVTSQPASLTLTGAPPSVFMATSNALICAWRGPTLQVTASGSPPLFYQWRFNGSDLAGANTNSISLSNHPDGAGTFSVVVTNAYGAATSSVVSVELGPSVIEQPRNQTVSAGLPAVIEIIVDACEPSYQWHFNGAPLAGQTNYRLQFASMTLAEMGDYFVVVSDSFRSITSRVARIEIYGLRPAITRQLADLLDYAFTWDVYLSVEYLATPEPVFQWRFNGADLPGETNTYLRFSPTPDRQGGYSVVLSNSFGAVTSRVAQFSLPVTSLLPGIQPYGQPQSRGLCPQTNSIHLSVSTVNPPTVPLFFQWRKDGAELPGATNSHLLLDGTPGDAGDYIVVITNNYGAVTSEVAQVALTPVIQDQPNDVLGVRDGTATSIYVGVDSCVPFTVLWQRNGVDVPGRTNGFLFFSPVTLNDAGDYRAIIQNSYGATTSRVARLEVVQYPPTITIPEHPVDQDILAEGYAYFFVSYYGAPLPSAQWWFNDTPLPGETNASLSFAATSTNRAGNYYAVLSNVVGVVTSRVARLHIIVKPPEIVAPFHPVDRVVEAGQYTYFDVSYEAAPPPSFQWRFNGVDIPGATNQFYNIYVASNNQAGGYSVVLRNDFGTATSRVAQLTVLIKPPLIVMQPEDLFVAAGVVASFRVGVQAAPPPAFQWRFNDANIPGATNQFLNFTAGYTNQEGGYSVVVSNEFGSVTSRVAMLDILIVEPRFSAHPRSMTVLAGTRVFMSIALLNSAPAFFQWQFNGADLPGETNYFLYVFDAQNTNAGAYRVIAWNDAGRATSEVATLTVRLPGTLDNWHRRRPFPQGNDLYSVTHDGTRFLAVGDTGAIITSTNGVDWADSHLVGDETIRFDLAAGNGVFVTPTLHAGGLQASSDGVNWQPVGTELSPLNVQSITFGAGRFVAVGPADGGGGTAISTNGWDWQLLPAFTSLQPDNVGFAGGRFLTGGLNVQGGSSRIFISPDGETWTGSTESSGLGFTTFSDFAYGNGVYVAVAYGSASVATSSDGTNWAAQPIASGFWFYPNAVAYGAGRFVAAGWVAGGPCALTSTDGVNWSLVSSAPTNQLWDVTFAAGRFVAVGNYGVIATSTDGVNWSDLSIGGSDRNLRDITRGGGLCVAVGNGGMLFTSPDGRTWTERDSGVPGNLRAATFFQSRFVVVGDIDNAGGTVLNSADGLTWSRTSVPASLFGLAHNGERLVAVGNNGVVLNSTDGLAWSSVFNATNSNPAHGVDLNAVTWGGGRFVAVGRNGRVLVSSNGWQWAAPQQVVPANLHGVAYGNGIYVAVARNGWVARSTNAIDWEAFTLPDADEFSDIGFGGGQFIAVGDDGLMFSTTDGLDWIRRSTSCQFDLRAVLYSEGSFFIAGDNETILQSPQLGAVLRITWQPAPAPGRTRVEMLCEVGRAYRLQVSENLQQWTDLYSFTASQEVTYFAERLTGTPRSKFYRLVSP